MRKSLTFIIAILLVFSLASCRKELDPDIVALQTQYDNYRAKSFYNYEQFAEFINLFSLETIQSGVYISTEYLLSSDTTSMSESYGIIVHQDLVSYYAVTTLDIPEEPFSRRIITVRDNFGVLTNGIFYLADETLGLVLIQIPKTQKELEVVKFSDAIPLQDEPIVLVSDLDNIRNQILLGHFEHHDDEYRFMSEQLLDEGAIGGGVFDINQNFIGLIVSHDNHIVLYNEIWSLIESIL